MSGPRRLRQANRADLAAQYTGSRSPTARHVVHRVLGTELANGYTTVEQADELMERLELDPGDRLLDLGAGRGWPGGYISERSGAHLVSTDLTPEAVAAAREHLTRTGVGSKTWLAAASGSALPFGDATFDGVVHADVLC
jgi:ubiquinone/menaquinone biosynthesis C-methylase UbiE